MTLEQLVGSICAKGISFKDGGGTTLSLLTSPEIAGILHGMDELVYSVIRLWLLNDTGATYKVLSEIFTLISDPKSSGGPVEPEHLMGVTLAIMQTMTRPSRCRVCDGEGWTKAIDDPLPCECRACGGARVYIASKTAAEFAGISETIWSRRRYTQTVRYWVKHLNYLILQAEHHVAVFSKKHHKQEREG